MILKKFDIIHYYWSFSGDLNWAPKASRSANGCRIFIGGWLVARLFFYHGVKIHSQKKDTFKLVIAILVYWHIPAGFFLRQSFFFVVKKHNIYIFFLYSLALSLERMSQFARIAIVLPNAQFELMHLEGNFSYLYCI